MAMKIPHGFYLCEVQMPQTRLLKTHFSIEKELSN